MYLFYLNLLMQDDLHLQLAPYFMAMYLWLTFQDILIVKQMRLAKINTSILYFRKALRVLVLTFMSILLNSFQSFFHSNEVNVFVLGHLVLILFSKKIAHNLTVYLLTTIRSPVLN